VKRWKFIAMVVGVAPLLAGATGPTTQPGEGATGKISAKSEPTTRPDRLTGADEGGRRGRLGLGPRLQRADRPTAADWDSISGFMKEHSPVRLKFINDLPDGPNKADRMANMIRDTRDVERLEKDDPDLAHMMTRRVELEDGIFDLLGQIRGADDDHVGQVKLDLRKKVAQWVDTNINERKLRIKKLQRTLEMAQQSVDRDDSQRERIVDRRLNIILEDAQRPNGPLEAAPNDPVLASPEANTEVTPTQKQK
jgi:hypothetical protein